LLGRKGKEKGEGGKSQPWKLKTWRKEGAQNKNGGNWLFENSVEASKKETPSERRWRAEKPTVTANRGWEYQKKKREQSRCRRDRIFQEEGRKRKSKKWSSPRDIRRGEVNAS